MAQNGPKWSIWSKMAQSGPVTKLWVIVGKNTFRMSTAQNGPKRPKVVPDSHRLWVLLGKNDPTCFLARPIWKKTLPCLFYYYAKWTYLTQKQTNKETNKQTNKNQDLSEKIHQLYIENTYFCFRRNANKKTLSDKDCFLSLCWACFSISYIFCDFKWS